MTRIFITLATCESVALVTSFSLGVLSQLRDSNRHAADPTYLLHFLVGLAAAIGSLLVHCLIFTYFLGTGRWVKEVKLAYHLPDAPLARLTRELKRRTFPPALFAMLITIAAAAAGAGTQQGLAQWPWQLHGVLAVASLIVNFWAFRVEYQNVGRNAGVIDAVLAEVDRIRREQGLSTNTEALHQAN